MTGVAIQWLIFPPLTQGRAWKPRGREEKYKGKRSPLTQGRELKRVRQNDYMTVVWSPLTQGRELKLADSTRIRDDGVAPHAGA